MSVVKKFCLVRSVGVHLKYTVSSMGRVMPCTLWNSIYGNQENRCIWTSTGSLSRSDAECKNCAFPSISQVTIPKRKLCHISLLDDNSSTEDFDSLYKLIELEIKAHDMEVLNSYTTFITTAAEELDIQVSSVLTPKKIIEKYSQLKSVHVHKKHFVQYETRTHFKTIQVKHLTGSTADTFLEYVERNLPEGIAMKVTRHKIEALPDHLIPPDTPESTT